SALRAFPRFDAARPSVRQTTLVSTPRCCAIINAPPKAPHSSSGWAVKHINRRGNLVLLDGQCSWDGMRFFYPSVESSEEIGRVPHVRPGVHGPKKTGAAQQSLLTFDKSIS